MKNFDIGKLLQDVDKMVGAIAAESDKRLFAEDVDSEALQRTGPEALQSLVEHSRDGSMQCSVSDDKMEVRADFYPPAGQGKPLTIEACREQLEKLGVTHGILHPVLERVVAETLMTQKAHEDIVIAKGTAPVDYLPERWELLPELTARKKVLDQKAVFLDFKTQSPFVLVHRGDLLARRIPEQPGSGGYDVGGKAIEFVKKTPPIPLPGENVEPSEAGFVATCDGNFRFEENRFWVDKVLVLESGVDYSTGHIDFAGDVQITGDIAAGFHIHAQGSVISSQVIDASEIVCGGDVITPFGIIGREGSVVKAEGRVRAKFLENVYVLARGELDIQTSVLNCWLQTLDRLVMGEKGMLMGGKVQAQNGVDVYQIGSERGGKAELICGMDFSVVEKIEWAKDQSLGLIKQLKVLEASKLKFPDKAAAITQACAKVRDQILKMNELSRSLVTKIDKNEDATVIVRGTVHAGTYIEICHVSYVVAKAVSHVKFSLDKYRGLVKAAPL